MPDTATVNVSIPVDVNIAPALENVMMRVLAGRMVSRVLERASVERLFEVTDALNAEAHIRPQR